MDGYRITGLPSWRMGTPISFSIFSPRRSQVRLGRTILKIYFIPVFQDKTQLGLLVLGLP